MRRPSGWRRPAWPWATARRRSPSWRPCSWRIPTTRPSAASSPRPCPGRADRLRPSRWNSASAERCAPISALTRARYGGHPRPVPGAYPTRRRPGLRSPDYPRGRAPYAPTPPSSTTARPRPACWNRWSTVNHPCAWSVLPRPEPLRRRRLRPTAAGPLRRASTASEASRSPWCTTGVPRPPSTCRASCGRWTTRARPACPWSSCSANPDTAPASPPGRPPTR